MLIGFDKQETWPRIWHRFQRLVDYGIEPYPMVYDRSRTDLLCFQRWVVRGLYRTISWPEYKRSTKSIESLVAWHEVCNGALKTPDKEQAAILARRIMEARDRIWDREPAKHITVDELVRELRDN